MEIASSIGTGLVGIGGILEKDGTAPLGNTSSRGGGPRGGGGCSLSTSCVASIQPRGGGPDVVGEGCLGSGGSGEGIFTNIAAVDGG